MQIHIIAIGERVPVWVEAGYLDYARRLPAQCRVRLIEVPAIRRGRNADIARILRDEGERLLAAVPADTRVIALERTGRTRSTDQLAQALEGWLRDGQDVGFMIGGPEGLSPACLEAAVDTWSLSALTLPHALVRVLLAEQLYRAWSIVNHMPYHRGTD